MTTLNLENIDLGGFGATDVKPEGEGTGFVGEQYSLDSHASSTMGEALKTDADQFSKNKQLSRDSGMPTSAVITDPAAVETDLKLKNIDFSEMSRRTPGTSLFLTDFNNAVIGQDDVSAMQRVEDTLRSIPGGLVTGFGMAIEGTGRTGEAINRIGTRALFSVTPESLEPYLFQQPETPDVLKVLNDFSNLITPAALTRSAGAGLKESGEDISGVPAERQNIATDIAGGLGQVGGQIAATIINPSIALGMMFGQGVDQQGERQEASGTEGRDNVSDFALLAGGGITAVTERTGIDALMNRIPPTIKNRILRQVADISIAGGIEAVQEVVEGIAQGLLEQYTTNPDAEIFEGLDREAIAAGGTGAIVRGIINAITPGKVRSVNESDDHAITQGQIEQTTLDTLNTQLGSMKMQQRDPETMRAFIEKVDDGDTHIFIDSLQASLYLKDKTPEEIAADPSLQLMVNRLVEATVTGADVEVSLEDFAVDLAGSTTFDELRDHMTMSPEAVTPFRAEATREASANYVQELMAEAEQNVSQYVEAQEIFETVRQQLVDTGQVTPQNASVMAQVVPAWATVYAKTNGISVQEAFAKSGLNIEGPQTGERARLEGELEILKQGSPELQEVLSMDEDAFIESVNPDNKVIEADDIIKLNIGDLPVPESTQPVSSFKADGQDINIVSDNDGNMYAMSDGNVLGFIGPAEDNETAIDVVTEAKGQGVGKELTKAFIRENPRAPSGGFTPAGEATFRAAFRELKAEQTTSPVTQDVPAEQVTEFTEDGDVQVQAVQNVADAQGITTDEVDESFKADVDQARWELQKQSPSELTKAIEDYATTNNVEPASVAADVYDNTGVADQVVKQGEQVLRQDEVTTARDQLQPDKNLFVAHNLSSENILAAADLGGLAAPSLAVARADISDFSGFGEVTLLADPSLLEDSKARTFDADVYTPRQPRATYKINLKKYSKWRESIEADTEGLNLSLPASESLTEQAGADNMLRSDSVKYAWLKEQGKEPKLKNRKVEPTIKAGAKFEGAVFMLRDDPKFLKLADKHYRAKVDKLNTVDTERAERFEAMYYNEDGTLKSSKINDFTQEVIRFRESGGKDLNLLRQDISTKFRNNKLREQFEQEVTKDFNELVDGKTLFKGFTDSGNKRFTEYNMVNVVREMTQSLQGGEASFYGAPSVRSAHANEMKNIAQVQARRDQIIPEADLAELKEDASSVFENAMEDLKPFYKFDADSWGYAEDAGTAIIEGPKGIREAFNVTPEVKKIIDDLTEYLSALPSTYFETKVQRAVDFSEFDTAVVPRGMNKEALQVLKDAGLKVKTYNPKEEGARAEVIAKQKKLLFQTDEGDKGTRGYYDPANSMIRLTESADLSTFLHEFAHFMYEMELNTDSDTSTSINNWFKRNASAVALEAGTYEPNTTIIPRHVIEFLDNGTTGDARRDMGVRRAVHEQFARGFETYLMEGRAPSVELRNAFRTFARWMTQIYRAVRGDLNVNLDAEMRQVFGRLLATDDQIAAANARDKHAPMFTDAAVAGMTEEQFKSYNDQIEKVKDVETETLRDKLIKEITRSTKKQWNDEKSDIIDEQLDILKEEKVYRATEQLRNGDIKLDHATVKDMVGFERTDKRGRKSTRIPESLNGMTAKGQEGIHPDTAAAMLGYSSGSEMINDLMNAAPINKLASDNAEAIMLERHGDIMNDGTIEKEADDAVHNEERGKLILQELKALRRGTNTPSLERAQIKAFAEETIGNLTYKTIFPGKYRKAEIAAAQESAAALATGDKQAAATAKARQVLNYYLGNAAAEARVKTEKIVDNMARYTKKKVREEIQKADGGYWEQIVKILNRFEFRKTATLKSVDERNVPITEWMNERVDVEGDALVITNAVLNETYQTHWKNVPFNVLTGVNDSVKNIEHVARYGNKIRGMGELVDFKKFVNQWTDHMDAVQDTRFKSQRTDVVEGRKWGRWAMAQMTKIPYLASWLDGGERVGMSHDTLVQPFTDAYNEEVKLWAEAGKPVMELIEGRDKATIKRHNTKIFIPEIKDQLNDGNLFGHQVLAVALNTGNAENLRKMLLGEGWADPDVDTDISFQNPQLQAVLKHMTKADWEMVQAIWDRMDTLYAPLAEVHRKTTGLVPPKVASVPVVTDHGTFKGGYYPLKYDPSRSNRAAENEERLNASTDSMFSGSLSIQSSVSASATNERTGYYGPIRLSLDVVPNHFQETIHFITHHDAVRQTNKLIRDNKVTNVIKAKLGPEEYAQLKPWLNDIAKDGREAPTKMFWDKALQQLRFGVTLGAMGFKASTGIIQISGLSNTIAELGLKPVYQAMRSILASENTIKSAWDFAVANSKVMAHRVNTMDREIKNAMSKIEGKRGLLAAAQETSMKHIAYIQTYMVDLPSWHAAYIKSMEEHGDEARAYKHADWVIENIQGSGVTKDMAQIMRGQSETGRMFTMFMTFFSALWNLERDLVKGAKSGRYSVTTTAAKGAFLFTLPVLFEMMMRGELGGEDDEPEEQLQKMLTKVAMFPIQSVPFVRDIANAVGGDFGYNMSPLASILEQGTQAIPKLVQNSFTDDEITFSQVKGSVKFAGAAAGIPGIGQAFATGEHIYDVIEEGEEFTMHQLLFGPKRD